MQHYNWKVRDFSLLVFEKGKKKGTPVQEGVRKDDILSLKWPQKAITLLVGSAGFLGTS